MRSLRPLVPLLLLLVIGCAGGESKTENGRAILRVACFPNVTHSQALIGLARGDFQRALGPDVELRATMFNAGPTVIEALFAGQLDLAYIGPNPAINGWVQSRGEALRIVAGATSGGAALIARADSGISGPADLAGRTIASPQLGNTQDVALRSYLASLRLATEEKGGSVRVVPTPNPEILDLFRQRAIDAAWVPEPWASRLVVEAGGRVLLDERSIWPTGEFVTAHVIVSRAFLAKHPELVERWLDAHVDVTRWELEHPAEAQRLLNGELQKHTGRRLDERVLAMAWERMRPTWDPLASTLRASAASAQRAGFLRATANLDGIYDLGPLNRVLQKKGLAEVRQ